MLAFSLHRQIQKRLFRPFRWVVKAVTLAVAVFVVVVTLSCAGIWQMPSQAAAQATTVEVLFATDREWSEDDSDFGTAPAGELSYGIARVAIPPRHKAGHLEGAVPTSMRHPGYHVALTEVELLSQEDFAVAVTKRLDSSRDRTALVFLMGYGLDFDGGARRMGQMAADMDSDCVPILYSWSSAGNWTYYTTDLENVEESVPPLGQLIDDVRGASDKVPGARVALAAHSMGSLAAMGVLEENALRLGEGDSGVARVDDFILFAPDIKQTLFAERIERLRPAVERITLFVSDDDYALEISRKLRKKAPPRAGDASDGVPEFEGVEVVDASEMGEQFFGHTYYRDSPKVLAVLSDLMKAE